MFYADGLKDQQDSSARRWIKKRTTLPFTEEIFSSIYEL